MSDPEQCPLCEAEAVNHDIEFTPGVCAECGFVVKNRDQTVDPDQTVSADGPELTPPSEPFTGGDQVVEVKDSSEQNLVELLSMTETLGETLLLSPEGRIRAAEIVTEAWRNNILHGRSMSAGAGAAVHIACRELGCPRPVRRIADAAEIDQAVLYGTYQPLADVLSLDLDSPQPIEFVPFICESLERSPAETAAQDLLRNRKKEIAGNPAGTAAAAVYIALRNQTPDDAVTYRRVGEVVKKTKETVWKRATELRQLD